MTKQFKYPFVGRFKFSGVEMLFIAEGLAAGDKEPVWPMDNVEDITEEYLANSKIKVLNEEHSRQIQEMSFRYGYGWYVNGNNVDYVDPAYLFFSKDTKVITHGHGITNSDFQDDKDKEIKLPFPSGYKVEEDQEEEMKEFKIGDKVLAPRGGELKEVTLAYQKVTNSGKPISIVFEDNERPWWVATEDLQHKPCPKQVLSERLQSVNTGLEIYDKLAEAIVNNEIEGLTFTL